MDFMNKQPDFTCDLFVVGQGLTGMAAALFASNRGLSVCQAGKSHPLVFHSGLFDLLGAYPPHMRTNIADPWDAVDELKKKDRKHPYSKVTKKEIRQAFEEIKDFLGSEELYYEDAKGKNSELITSIGTVKSSYLIPKSMQSAVQALKKKQPLLIAEIKGLREFTGIQIQETLKQKWPDITVITLDLPFGRNGENNAEHLARALDVEKNRRILSDALKPHVLNHQVIGFPPVLGIQKNADVINHLERELGVPVFEIPSLPPGPPGVRLKEAFERGLDKKGIIRFGNDRIDKIQLNPDKTFSIVISTEFFQKTIKAKGVVLATGRFLGKGLVADGKNIREPLFNIPVIQPDSRSGWFRPLFFDIRGHSINKSGIMTDSYQRPFGKDGTVMHDRLFAAGSIIAHQDWTREKSGSGIALATGFKAVKSFIELNEGMNIIQDCLSA